ncbi:MAG: hypothetical protein AMJ53_07200 [Gammaproteobacteria bacterium SG8_11]|nr:MAG: hypothetical protein AMJ53_07200 [Gammaproteobacteria bacterium SG8_11]
MNIPMVVRENPRIILFDGVCNLCSTWVQFVFRRDPDHKFKFVSVQFETGKALLTWCGLPNDHYDTMVYIDHGTVHTRSQAFLKIVQHFQPLWPLLRAGILIPRFIRDWMYDRIALNRYCLFGKTDACFTPSDELSKRFL